MSPDAKLDAQIHAAPPSVWHATSSGVLLLSLVVVMLLAKGLAPTIELMVSGAGAPKTLGLDIKLIVLLLLSLFVSTLSLGTGRTTILQGVVHLVILATYLFVTVVP